MSKKEAIRCGHIKVKVYLYVNYESSSTVIKCRNIPSNRTYCDGMRYETWHISTFRTYFLILSLSDCALGSHITIVAHTRSVQITLDAAKQLEGEGVDCEVGLCHTKQTSNSNDKKMIKC